MRQVIVIFFMSLVLLSHLYPQTSSYKDMKNIIDIEWENAQIIDHPVYGVLILSKDRWKNWIFRSLIVVMVYITLASILLALPKTHEFNFIVSYIFCGALFVISFWLNLCGWMLMRLGVERYGWAFEAVSIPMYLGAYFMTLKVKKDDISYAKIRDEIKRLREEELKNYQDPRLYAISGEYGEWEDEDFLRRL